MRQDDVSSAAHSKQLRTCRVVLPANLVYKDPRCIDYCLCANLVGLSCLGVLNNSTDKSLLLLQRPEKPHVVQHDCTVIFCSTCQSECHSRIVKLHRSKQCCLSDPSLVCRAPDVSSHLRLE